MLRGSPSSLSKSRPGELGSALGAIAGALLALGAGAAAIFAAGGSLVEDEPEP